MAVIQIVITAKSPLVFSERRPGNQFRHSTPYVPGAALRGALAQQMLEVGEGGDRDFQALFIQPNPALFRNGYPACLRKSKEAQGFTCSRPLPATALSCKAESGFDRHGVFDSLIDRLCCEELGVKVSYLPRCRSCGDRVEAFSGFHAGQRSVTVPSQLTTRVALNRRRKTAEEGLLYSPLVISEATKERWKDEEGKEHECYVNMTFRGSVVVTDEDEAKAARNRLCTLTHLGSGATRGLGRVEVKVLEDNTPDDLKQRAAQFNQRIKERWTQWKQLPHTNDELRYTADNGAFFAILLVSDAILRADDWTSTLRLEAMMLGDALKDAALLRCYVTADYRGGWNTGWGLPKDTELVARMGSVYVYHTSRNPGDAALLNALRVLEEQGVGERRVEGFGEVRVCDEFHLEIQEVTT